MKTNLPVNAVIFLIFLIGFEPALTGNAAHEWLNLAFTAALVVHLLMHWDWMTAMLRRKLRTMSRSLRLNLFLNLALFVVLVMMILSGVMISRKVMAAFRVASPTHTFWHELHSGFGNVLLVLIGLHFALHWKWIVHACTSFAPVTWRRRQGRQLTGAC